MKRITGLLSLLMCAALCLGGMGCTKKEKVYRDSRFDCFDTFSTLTVYTDSRETFDTYFALFGEELVRYHQLLDIYHTYEGIHNLKTINDAHGETVTVCPELADFLSFSKEAYEQTQGLTNAALGRVTALWHDAREQAAADPSSAALPDPQLLAEALRHTDPDGILLTDSTVCLSDPLLSLDAGALGKGYAARAIGEALSRAGCTDFLINLGAIPSPTVQSPGGSPGE